MNDESSGFSFFGILASVLLVVSGTCGWFWYGAEVALEKAQKDSKKVNRTLSRTELRMNSIMQQRDQLSDNLDAAVREQVSLKSELSRAVEQQNSDRNTSDKEKSKLNKQILTLEKAIKAADNALKTEQNTVQTLQAELETAQQALQSLSDNNDSDTLVERNEQLAEALATIEQLTTEKTALEEQVLALTDELTSETLLNEETSQRLQQLETQANEQQANAEALQALIESEEKARSQAEALHNEKALMDAALAEQIKLNELQYQEFEQLKQNYDAVNKSNVQIKALEAEIEALKKEHELIMIKNKALEDVSQALVQEQTARTDLQLQRKQNIDTIEKLKQQLLDNSVQANTFKKDMALQNEQFTQQLSDKNEALLKTSTQLDNYKEEKAEIERQLDDLQKEAQGLLVQLNDALKEQTVIIEQNKILEQEQQRQQKAIDALKEKFSQLSSSNDALVKELNNGKTIIRLQSKVLFESGSATISEQGAVALQAVADTLIEFPEYIIRVEGHTDNKAIGNELAEQFASNWDLSAARAAAAVNILVEYGVPANSMIAVGQSEFHPLVQNDNVESRQQNRRIDILLFPPVQQIYIDH